MARIFRPFYWVPVIVVALTGFVFLDAWIAVHNGPTRLTNSAYALIDRPGLTLLVMALLVLAGAFHERGHVTACRYGGARPGGMGVGMYLVWPAFYSTVTDSYRLSRGGRLRTDLGGVYFNVVFISGMSAAYLVTGSPWLLVAIVMQHIETAWQFLPSIRLDGYYILSDLVGVPDLFGHMRPVLHSLLPGRTAHPRVQELKPWVRRTITLWVALTIPTIVGYGIGFLVLAPRLVPAAWHSLARLGSDSVRAAGHGNVATAVLGLLDVVLLLLPWVGGAWIVVSLARQLTRAAYRKWGSKPDRAAPASAAHPVARRHRRPASYRRGCALGAAAAGAATLTVLVGVQLAGSASRPAGAVARSQYAEAEAVQRGGTASPVALLEGTAFADTHNVLHEAWPGSGGSAAAIRSAPWPLRLDASNHHPAQ